MSKQPMLLPTVPVQRSRSYTLTLNSTVQRSPTIVHPVVRRMAGHTNGSYKHASERSSITARRRGEVAAFVAHVKVVTTDTGLHVTSGVFEMLGARATGRKYGFDRFWRDLRTHSLHDPVAYKKREVGRWALLGEVSEPTWCTQSVVLKCTSGLFQPAFLAYAFLDTTA